MINQNGEEYKKRMSTYVKRNHFAVQQKLTQRCKSTILKSKKILKNINTASCFIYLFCWNEAVWLEVAYLASYSKDDCWEAFEAHWDAFWGQGWTTVSWATKIQRKTACFKTGSDLGSWENPQAFLYWKSGELWWIQPPEALELTSFHPQALSPSPGSHLSQNHRIVLSFCLPSPSLGQDFIYLCLRCSTGFL